MQALPITSAGTERCLFVLEVLRLLLGLGAVQPLFWLVSTWCSFAFLAVSLIYHLFKVGLLHLSVTPSASSQLRLTQCL